MVLSLLQFSLNSSATIHTIPIYSSCNNLINLCIGDTLRFCGDSLIPSYYGAIYGYVFNSTTQNYDYFSIVSGVGIATSYEHVLVSGDDYYSLQPCTPIEGYLDYSGCTVTSEENIYQRNDEVNLYPRPNNGVFTIELDAVENVVVEIYTISGQLILQQPLTKNITKVNLTKYPKGMYFVKVGSDSQTIVKKIVYQ